MQGIVISVRRFPGLIDQPPQCRLQTLSAIPGPATTAPTPPATAPANVPAWRPAMLSLTILSLTLTRLRLALMLALTSLAFIVPPWTSKWKSFCRGRLQSGIRRRRLWLREGWTCSYPRTLRWRLCSGRSACDVCGTLRQRAIGGMHVPGQSGASAGPSPL